MSFLSLSMVVFIYRFAIFPWGFSSRSLLVKIVEFDSTNHQILRLKTSGNGFKIAYYPGEPFSLFLYTRFSNSNF